MIAPRPHVIIATDAQPAMAAGDATLIRQAVHNMLRNALQHNLSNGGRVNVRTWSHGSCAFVSLANTGAHIRPDLIDSLREPFSRHARTVECAPGCGWLQ